MSVNGLSVGNCALCKQPVFHGHAAFPITGWEAANRQGAGGANRVIDRQRVPGYVVHVSCAESRARRRRAGISDDQESLL